MNFDLADLRAFVAVADLGSFSAAAASLHLSQPALSRRVGKLETSLGVRLLERTTRRVTLSAIGRSFVPRARHVLNEADGALLGMRDTAERMLGQLTIACVPSTVGNLLAGVLARFNAAYPRIRLRLIDAAATETLEAVLRGDADFGLTYLGIQDPGIEFTPLLAEPFVLACRHDHALAARRRLQWTDLAGHAFVSLAPGTGNRMLIDQALARSAQRPAWTVEVQHVPALVSLVEAGLGVGVVPKFSLSHAHPVLRTVPIGSPKVAREIGVIRRRGIELAVPARHFIEMLKAGVHRDARPPRNRK